MIDYEFLERRVDQLLDCPEHGTKDADYMVDALYVNNYQKFMQYNNHVEDICKELWDELESIVNPNEDIPF